MFGVCRSEFGGSVWEDVEEGLFASFSVFDRGVVFVGALEIMCVIRSGTAEGVTLSMNLKEGRSKTVVPSAWEWEWCGSGMFEAESIIFCETC